MKKNILKRIGAMALSAVMALSFIPAALAANSETATIDTSRDTSLTLYKYDLTAAQDAGAWETTAYVSTGLLDESVNTVLSPYAIQGVEFSYVRVADLSILKEDADGAHTIKPLYGFTENTKTGSQETMEFLSALGLTTNDAYTVERDAQENRIWYFESDVLINALSDALATNATSTKAALESYMTSNGGTAMPETDENGKSAVTGLAQGLYLLVETRVPENVVDTTDPFLVSLPMTTVDGNEWNYDLTLYPKNSTGNPTLEKTVRETKTDTGRNGGNANDITDGYAHTATASDGDTVEYQIISTLPTITSPATALSTYTFVDELSKGIRYTGEQFDTKDVKLEFFKDNACIDPIAAWTEADGKFTVSYTDYSTEAGSKMTIAMTEEGLKEINSADTVYDPATSLLWGYSNCTLRITYACTVNSDATVVYGDSGNPNTVELTWRRTNAEYFDTLQDCCHVYTYGLDLTKLFSDKNGNFSKVNFLLKNDTDGYYVQAALDQPSGIYYVTGHTDQESEASSFVPVSSGKITVKGLEDDSYVITETATDSGYTLLKETISVEITSTEGQETCELCGAALRTANAKVNSKAVSMQADNSSVNAIAPLTVTNTRNFTLPKTGGSGTRNLYLFGGIAVIAGLGLAVVMLRKKRHA